VNLHRLESGLSSSRRKVSAIAVKTSVGWSTSFSMPTMAGSAPVRSFASLQ